MQVRSLGREDLPWKGRSPWGGNGNPLQYSCLEKYHGQGSLVGYSPWGCKELDTTEWLTFSCGARALECKGFSSWAFRDKLYSLCDLKSLETLNCTCKITTDGDCSHEIKRCLLLGRKVMTNLDSILKSRDIPLPTKVRLVKAQTHLPTAFLSSLCPFTRSSPL